MRVYVVCSLLWESAMGVQSPVVCRVYCGSLYISIESVVCRAESRV